MVAMQEQNYSWRQSTARNAEPFAVKMSGKKPPQQVSRSPLHKQLDPYADLLRRWSRSVRNSFDATAPAHHDPTAN